MVGEDKPVREFIPREARRPTGRFMTAWRPQEQIFSSSDLSYVS